ncbi:MAG: hypothetical protein ABI672_00925 [Vicinamibacteria bacterium]
MSPKSGSDAGTKGRMSLRIAIFSVATFLSLVGWCGIHGWSRRLDIVANKVIPVSGHSYCVDVAPGAFGWIDTRWDTETQPNRSPLVVIENGTALGPAHSFHSEIAATGKGRFSHWGKVVYFSASDNTDPRQNRRSYRLEYRLFLPRTAGLVALVSAGILWAILLGLLLRPLVVRLAGSARARSIWGNVTGALQGAVITAVATLLFLGLGEGWMRLRRPFLTPLWPSQPIPLVGFTFTPHSLVRWTNQLDYWNEGLVNSLGFLDREPSADLTNSANCNVTFLGDSFVEAAQVPIEQKSHVLFETMAQNQLPDRSIRSQAFGYSGTGQVNQVPFYTVFARPLHPRVVVLVFASNDLANNSSLLEGVRNGWDPTHAPRPFARRSGESGIERLPPADDWADHLLKPLPKRPELAWWSSLHIAARDHSYLYSWAWANAKLKYPAVAARIDPTSDVTGIQANNKAQIGRIAGLEHALDGWAYPNDLDLDLMFDAKGPLPPAFEDAWTYTAFGIDTIRAEAAKDGASVVALISTTFANELSTKEPASEKPRPRVYHTAFDRLIRLLRDRQIPYVDQQTYIDEHGIKSEDIRFAHDGHWSSIGHQAAAGALIELFKKNPALCRP